MRKMNPEPKKEHALVFAANNAFGAGFLVSLASVLSCSNLSNFRIYFLHDSKEDVTELVERALKLCTRFGFPEFRFKSIQVNLSEFEQCQSYAGNHLTYARIFAIRHLREDIIFYLDSDTLVLEDISRLVDSLNNDFLCAVSKDSCIRINARDGYKIDGKICTDDSPYFNSGVMVLNTRACRDFNLYEKFKALVPRLSNSNFGDQSYLNAILRDKWTPIPSNWNRFTDRRKAVPIFSAEEPINVLHFVSTSKPWNFPRFDTGNVLWHSIASFLGVEVSQEVTDVLEKRARHVRTMRQSGLFLIEPFWYGLMSDRSKRKRLYKIRQNYIKEFTSADRWLTRNGFNPIPKEFRIQ